MSFHQNPRIVTDGLVLCFDAADNKSLPVRDLPVKGSNLVCWYDAADENTIVYGSSSFVTTWEDKSGHGHHLYQNVVANQPNRVNTHNGKYILDFDGSNDYLRTSSSIDVSSEWTMFIVERRGGAGSSDAGLISINDSLASGITMHFANAYFYWGSGGNNVSTTTTLGQTYILSKAWDGSSSGTRFAYKDGVDVSNTGTMTNTSTTGALRLGNQSTYFSGSIAEVIIYDKKLNDTDYALVHTYLQNKWGVATSGSMCLDRALNNYSGSLTDTGATYTNSYNGAFVFDGTSGYIQTNYTETLGDVTIECWYKGTDATRNHLLNFGTSPTTNLSFDFNDTYDLWIYWESGGTNRVRYNIDETFTDSTVKHLVFTHTYSTNAVFLNGSELTISESSGNQYFTAVNSTGFFGIGGPVFPFQGEIYIVRLYDRVLSDSEILQNYRALKHRFGH